MWLKSHLSRHYGYCLEYIILNSESMEIGRAKIGIIKIERMLQEIVVNSLQLFGLIKNRKRQVTTTCFIHP